MLHEMLRRFVSTGCEVHQAVISLAAKSDTSDKSDRVFKGAHLDTATTFGPAIGARMPTSARWLSIWAALADVGIRAPVAVSRYAQFKADAPRHQAGSLAPAAPSTI